MTSDDFYKICLDVSRLAVKDIGRVGNLRLTQKTKRGEPTYREPEMRHAFCRTLDDLETPTPYGIEVPTEKTYRFVEGEGVTMRKALHDLVLYDGEKANVLVELKTGQPGGEDSPAIGKDLQKLLREKAYGKAMFHICHGSKANTLLSLVGKYEKALASALKKVQRMGEVPEAGWLELFVLVLHDRNEKWQPFLHRYAAVTDERGFTPVFRELSKKVPVPRGE